MSGMGTAGTANAARLFAVLAVLMGVLAMHGVVSAHRAAAATPDPDHSAVLAVEKLFAETAGPHDLKAMQHGVTHPDATAPARPAGPSCHDDCRSVTALCVAVLAGAALALLLVRRRTSPLRLAATPRQARAPAASVLQARGPDPVRELCVSRT